MKLGGVNKHKSKICGGNNWTGSALFGGVAGGSNSEKLEKNQVFVPYEWVIRT